MVGKKNHSLDDSSKPTQPDQKLVVISKAIALSKVLTRYLFEIRRTCPLSSSYRPAAFAEHTLPEITIRLSTDDKEVQRGDMATKTITEISDKD